MRRRKPPVANRRQGAFVQSHSQPFHDLDPPGPAVAADQHTQRYQSLEFRLPRFVGIGRLRAIHASGGREDVGRVPGIIANTRSAFAVVPHSISATIANCVALSRTCGVCIFPPPRKSQICYQSDIGRSVRIKNRRGRGQIYRFVVRQSRWRQRHPRERSKLAPFCRQRLACSSATMGSQRRHPLPQFWWRSIPEQRRLQASNGIWWKKLLPRVGGSQQKRQADKDRHVREDRKRVCRPVPSRSIHQCKTKFRCRRRHGGPVQSATWSGKNREPASSNDA